VLEETKAAEKAAAEAAEKAAVWRRRWLRWPSRKSTACLAC